MIQHLLRTTAHPLLALPRVAKRLIAVFADVFLCVLTTWLAFYLRLGEFVSLDLNSGLAALVSVAIAIPIFVSMGLYRAIFRYSGWPAIQAVGIAMGLYGLIYTTIVMFYSSSKKFKYGVTLYCACVACGRVLKQSATFEILQ